MKNIAFILSTLAGVFCFNQVEAQNLNNTLFPSTPQAYAIWMYTDIPVSYYTGLLLRI